MQRSETYQRLQEHERAMADRLVKFILGWAKQEHSDVEHEYYSEGHAAFHDCQEDRCPEVRELVDGYIDARSRCAALERAKSEAVLAPPEPEGDARFLHPPLP